MRQFLRRIEDERNLLVELMALYNSGQIGPFLAEHLDDVAFMTPDGPGTRRQGSGKVALREDIRRFRGERGRLRVLDVLPFER